MKAKAQPADQADGKPEKKPLVQIVGVNRLQNELLAWFLRHEVGVDSTNSPDFSPGALEEGVELPNLVLLDCLGSQALPLWAAGFDSKDPEYSGIYLALFNVGQDKRMVREAMNRGVRGVFYETMPLPIFAKGVRMILSGELWYSRETLTTFLLEPESEAGLPEQVAQSLTPREREILLRIASGASNQEIADDLFISLHTVKSHIYNIYKKIDVPNRLQAALWVAKYL
ncbi:MAG: response regulator transcription factor [Thermodesulfobacteriota bacterium]